VLQGYELASRKIASAHIDILINKNKWPWLQERHLNSDWSKVIPPRGAALGRYEDLMQENKIGLDLTLVAPRLINYPCKLVIISNQQIHVLTTLANVRMFYEEVICKARKLDFDEQKRQAWIEKFKNVASAAEAAGDLAVVDYCNDKLRLLL